MSDQNPEIKEPKKKKKWRWIVIAIIVIIIISAISQCGKGGENTSSTPPSSANNTTSASAAPATKPYSATLAPGFYEIGTDIPAGTYDFEIASGNGNVVDINDGVNLVMGKQSGDMYQKTYKNAELTDGSTLFLSQCSIKVNSQNASTELKKRDNSSAKAADLSAGNYVAGKDFQPGYYDISLVSGQGNVICQDNQLNAIFSSDASFGVKEYKNVKFEEGNKLQIEQVKVKLTPSK